jgi:O-methyltransferase
MVSSVLKLGRKCINSCFRKHGQISCGLMMALDKDRQNFVFENEYVKTSSLELIANEIYDKNIVGSVAELGVYKGDFAKNINIAFPDRRLYLFDTFEGFDERDIKVEMRKGFSMGNQDFSETSVELVLSKMKHKKNCVIRKGYVPESINGGGVGGQVIYSVLSVLMSIYTNQCITD